MKLFAVLLATVAYAAQKSDKLHPVRSEIVEEIKLKATSWKPREVNQNHLRHIPVQNIHLMTGSLGMSPFASTVKKGAQVLNGASELIKHMTNVFGLKSSSHKLKGWEDWDVVDDKGLPVVDPHPTEPIIIDGEIYFDEEDDEIFVIESDNNDQPKQREIKEFNWRDKTPECIGQIEDQGDCGSCWAFSSSGLLADRFCIHSNGVINTRFSPQEMINCNYENFGCTGGYLMTTIDYLQIEGLVSNKCVPYAQKMNSCTYRCNDPAIPIERFYCEIGSFKVMTTHREIIDDLIKNGPMMMGLMIFEDFMSYAEGIYVQTTGQMIGGHAMKLIGFGEDPELGLYWILQNQWTTDWGDKGHVRIKAGEIGIDSVALSCMPDIIYV